jgi:4-amino-4-deoxy-L-arabinose transferase-like glycosyltransferase
LKPLLAVSRQPAKRLLWLELGLVVLVGLALRLYRLDFQSLWIDEALTFQSASVPMRQIIFDPTLDQNFPPLHNSLVHLSFLVLGATDWAARFPSIVAGVVSLPLIFAVARSWFGGAIGIIAAGLLAISPLHVWYSQEARPYALFLALGLASLWCAQRWLEQPSSRLVQAGLVLSASSTLYCHLLALPFLAFLFFYVLLRAQRGERTRLVLLFCGVVVLTAPQLYRFFTLPPNVSGNPSYRFEPLHLIYTLWTFGTGYSLGPSLLELRQGMTGLRPHLPVVVPLLLVLLMLFLSGALRLWRTGRDYFWPVMAWLTFPMAFAVLGATLTAHPYNVRYVLISLPAFLLVLSVAVLPRSRTVLGSSRLLFLVAVSATALYNYYSVPAYHRENTRQAVAFLNANAASGESLLVSAPYTLIVLRHYGLRRDLSVEPYPRAGSVGPPEEVATELRQITGGRERVWVFLSRTFHSDPGGEIERYFDTHLVREQEHDWAGVRLLVYHR